MIIIEKSSIGKKSQETCEDGIVVTNHFIAVVDGSTSKSRHRFHAEMSNGQYCMRLVCQYVESMPADINVEKFCQLITSYIQFLYSQYDCDMKELANHPTERMAASAVIYSMFRKEIWMIGDCQCLVDGLLYENPKPYEEPIADMRSAFIRLALLNGSSVDDFQTVDKGREFILPILIENCKKQNKTFAVIDGFPIPMKHVKVIPADNVQEIVLASDGYPILKPTLNESEQALSSLVAEDPLFIRKFKATKGVMKGNSSFDDRTYIRFRA